MVASTNITCTGFSPVPLTPEQVARDKTDRAVTRLLAGHAHRENDKAIAAWLEAEKLVTLTAAKHDAQGKAVFRVAQIIDRCERGKLTPGNALAQLEAYAAALSCEVYDQAVDRISEVADESDESALETTAHRLARTRQGAPTSDTDSKTRRARRQAQSQISHTRDGLAAHEARQSYKIALPARTRASGGVFVAQGPKPAPALAPAARIDSNRSTAQGERTWDGIRVPVALAHVDEYRPVWAVGTDVFDAAVFAPALPTWDELRRYRVRSVPAASPLVHQAEVIRTAKRTAALEAEERAKAYQRDGFTKAATMAAPEVTSDTVRYGYPVNRSHDELVASELARLARVAARIAA